MSDRGQALAGFIVIVSIIALWAIGIHLTHVIKDLCEVVPMESIQYRNNCNDH